MPELFPPLEPAVAAAALGLSLFPPPNMFLPLFRFGDTFGDDAALSLARRLDS